MATITQVSQESQEKNQPDMAEEQPSGPPNGQLEKIKTWQVPEAIARVPDSQLYQDYCMAAAVCRASFIPAAARGSVSSVFYLIMRGRSLGLEPGIALSGALYMTPNGTVGMEASLIRAILLKQGFKIIRHESSAKKAVVEVIRPDDSDRFTATWTIERASGIVQGRGKLTDKDNWKNYPENMLRHRALVEAAREVASDVLFNIYLPEELEDTAAEIDPQGSRLAAQRVAAEKIVELKRKRGEPALTLKDLDSEEQILVTEWLRLEKLIPIQEQTLWLAEWKSTKDKLIEEARKWEKQRLSKTGQPQPVSEIVEQASEDYEF